MTPKSTPQDLVEELRKDILELGNFSLWAVSKEVKGKKEYLDYEFVDEHLFLPPMTESKDVTVETIPLEKGSTKEKMAAREFLLLLEKEMLKA